MTNISTWMKNSWRPTAAYVYLVICLCDFAGMPIYYTAIMNKQMNADHVSLAMKFDNPTAQIEALKAMRQTSVWEPITLHQNGLFHMAFGAILGVAAWTRGQEKVEEARRGSSPQPNPQPDRPTGPRGRPVREEGEVG